MNIIGIILIALNIAAIVFSVLKIFAKAVIFIAKNIANEPCKVDFKTELYVASICTFCTVCTILSVHFLL